MLESTSAAVKAAVRDKLRAQNRKPSTPAPPPSAVQEFHSASATGAASGNFLFQAQPKNDKSLGLHGDVYGETAAGAPSATSVGGAVGATSKSGKFHVFVQTDHTKVNPQNPD